MTLKDRANWLLTMPRTENSTDQWFQDRPILNSAPGHPYPLMLSCSSTMTMREGTQHRLANRPEPDKLVNLLLMAILLPKGLEFPLPLQYLSAFVR